MRMVPHLGPLSTVALLYLVGNERMCVRVRSSLGLREGRTRLLNDGFLSLPPGWNLGAVSVVKGPQSRTRIPSGRESHCAKTRVLHIAPMTAGQTGC